jgi:hypothetical protein
VDVVGDGVGRGGDGLDHEVADAARLERTRRLQVLILQVDIAAGGAGERRGVDGGCLYPWLFGGGWGWGHGAHGGRLSRRVVLGKLVVELAAIETIEPLEL